MQAQRYNEYKYIFHESTGVNKFIIINNKEVPISINGKETNYKILKYFKSLNYRILYPRNNIYIIGIYNPEKHEFSLRNWYIKKPLLKFIFEDKVLYENSRIVKINMFTHEDFNFEKKEFDAVFANKFLR